MTDLILTNARIVLANEVLLGSVRVQDGLITDISTGPSSAAHAHDLDGDFLLPGLVEVPPTTGEPFTPRPKVNFPMLGGRHTRPKWPPPAYQPARAIGVGTVCDGFRYRPERAAGGARPLEPLACCAPTPDPNVRCEGRRRCAKRVRASRAPRLP